MVVVSHDRAFLDDVAQEIILFKDKKLTYHSGMVTVAASPQRRRLLLILHWMTDYRHRLCAGNYSEFRQNADEKRQHMQKMQDGLNKKKAHMEKSIQVSNSWCGLSCRHG